MEVNNVDYFVMTKGEWFPPESISAIRSKLSSMDENKALMMQSIEYRDPTLMLVLSILVGKLGVDRFLLGDTGLGVLKLLTCGGCGIWWLIDLFTVQKKTRQYNYQKFIQYSNY